MFTFPVVFAIAVAVTVDRPDRGRAEDEALKSVVAVTVSVDRRPVTGDDDRRRIDENDGANIDGNVDGDDDDDDIKAETETETDINDDDLTMITQTITLTMTKTWPTWTWTWTI